MLQPIPRDFSDITTTDQVTTEAPAAGLILLGVNSLLLSLYHAGFFPFGSQVLGMCIFYGATGMIATGLIAWKRHNVYGAVLSTAVGLFWISLVAMVIMPISGFGRAPQPSALSSYLAFWGLFTSIFLTGASRLGRELVIFLSMFAIFLMLLAVGAAAGSPLINAIAGGEGIACGLVGIYAGALKLRNQSR
jgi:succinate-acetate transporter protein